MSFTVMSSTIVIIPALSFNYGLILASRVSMAANSALSNTYFFFFGCGVAASSVAASGAASESEIFYLMSCLHLPIPYEN